MNGMVSGICIDWDKLAVIMVPNAAPEKGDAHGLPGGIIGRGESREKAMVREWKEEVWGHGTPAITFFRTLRKNGRDRASYHYQHLFVVEDSGRQKLRRSGVRGETKPPVHLSLWEVAKNKVSVFYSHKLAILELLEHAAYVSAKKDMIDLSKELSHIAATMDRNMKKIPKK